VTVESQNLIYHSTCGVTHTLTNNYAYVGYVQAPKESTYKCEMEDWWWLAWWSYVGLVAANIPAAILFRVPMYYAWGLTSSLQVVALAPILKSYLPSCLTYFLKDFMISHATHDKIFEWLYKVYAKIVVTENPLSYRLERHDFIYNSAIFNLLDIYIAWGGCFGLLVVFFVLRILFYPFHYWGKHFADLERSFRYQVFIRGFQLVFLKTVFCCLLNFRAVTNSSSD